MDVLSDGAFLATLVVAFANLTGRMGERRASGWLAITNGVSCIDLMVSDPGPWASVSAATAAWCAWRWWKGGGGDDTKRRLRRAKEAFTPVRRTAPASG